MLMLACAGPAQGSGPGQTPGAVSRPPPTRAVSPPPATVVEDPADPNMFRIGNATVTIELDGDDFSVPFDDLKTWVQHSGQMVADYYERFPVPSLRVRLISGGRGGVGFGQHFDGRWIRVWVGRRATPSSFEKDWVLVHEMLHAAFPDLERDHLWMQEGLSTYLEPVVRARAGNLPETEVWRRWTRSMSYGRPRAGDRGLDRTHTWGRTYWGGALFWLVADVEIRQRTNNQASLRDAVVAILKAGGNGRAEWSTRRVVEVGDKGTSTTVLKDLYAKMAEAPGDVDLDALWQRLGVIREADGSISFDEDAPLSHIRRAITRA